jgi:predicted GTPase
MEIDERVYNKLRKTIEDTKEKYNKIDKIIQDLKDGKIREFGELDLGDPISAAHGDYYPQRFIEIIDEKEGVVKIEEQVLGGQQRTRNICVLYIDKIIYNEED